MVSLTHIETFAADFDVWRARWTQTWTREQADMLRKAYSVAVEANVESDHSRGVEAAEILAELNLDADVVCAALLCESSSQTELKPEEIGEAFGESVAELVAGVYKLRMIGELHSLADESKLETLRKMLLAMAQDVRVVLIRLAIQVQVMRHVDKFDPEQRKNRARETLDLFAPLANRLGIARIKWELEDRALRVLDPNTYKTLAKSLDERRTTRERYIKRMVERLQTELAGAGIKATVYGRIKHIYSIWLKMQRKKVPFEEVFDVRALRIQVEDVAGCYAALGVVHALWSHIPEEFDDYIAHPKPNGYQSLHTAVLGPEGKTLEVQIRTRQMHEEAELGVAAHWRYKEGGANQGSSYDRQIAWLRHMIEAREEGDDSDLIDQIGAEAMQDRVYVITPDGEVVDLAQGSTPLDFAYNVHTLLGHRCRGAKVNGRIVPLTRVLKNGEQVEVLATKSGTPSRDWLNADLGYLHGARARQKVRQWFRQQDHDKNMEAGQASIDRELSRLGLRGGDLEAVARKFNFVRVDELYVAIGRGDLNTISVASAVQEQIQPAVKEDEIHVARRPRKPESEGEIQISGVGNLMTTMARCCKPVPPDSIVGFITQGRGVTVHRQDCANLMNLVERHGERLIEVDWGNAEQSAFAVDVVVEAYDRSGLLRDITSILANNKVNVTGATTHTDKENATARMTLTLEIEGMEQLGRVLAQITQLRNVISARRNV